MSRTRRSASRSIWPLLAMLLCGFLATASAHARAKAAPQIAPTPPMGWNSWDSYGLSVTETEWKQNVNWLHAHLQAAGWKYVVVDEGWYLAHPENAANKGDQGYTLDPAGRYIPAPNRFEQGLSGLASYAHGMGLSFGIHIIRGIPKIAVDKNMPIDGSTLHAAEAADTADTCRWNPDNYGVRDNAAGQAYYDSLMRLYASWGVDFLKVDCISEPYKANEIHMISAAIAKTGRPIVLSLSPGPTPLADGADVEKYAQMWRISDDVWDVWSDPSIKIGGFPQTVRKQFTNLSDWMKFQQPGHWPDADMLPIGYLGPRPGWGQARNSRLSFDETRTLLTLWMIARSPLILGSNLLQMDSFTESLLTNKEAIAVDQKSSGNRELLVDGAIVLWRADAPKGDDGAKGTYYAVFNLGNTPAHYAYKWPQLSLHGKDHKVRDLWQSQDIGKSAGLSGTLAPHASALYRVY
jgi:alpha-galactosidase